MTLPEATSFYDYGSVNSFDLLINYPVFIEYLQNSVRSVSTNTTFDWLTSNPGIQKQERAL